MATRRAVLQTLGSCALCMGAPAALAGVLNTDLTPFVTEGYAPLDQDERGMWQSFDQLEEQLKVSNRRIKAPDLNEYLKGILHRLLGEQADTVRIYVMRNPEFNATMAPNGQMIVHTGLLARVRNEAQLAAVLGHESGHYLRRHSLQGWRDRRSKSAVMAFVAAGANAATGYTGQSTWYDLANAINQNLVLSIFSYSRTLESEADAYGLKLLTQAGYPPESASQVWAQVIEERKASAAARKKKYKNDASAFSTHPPSEDRMKDLGVTAQLLRMRKSEAVYDDRRALFLAAIGPHRAELLEEQIKLNNPGASLYLINSLAQDGWDSVLKFYEGEAYRLRGEADDEALAAAAYKEAAAFPDASPEAIRAHGYAQIKHGSREDGLAALRHYLELKPDATDAQMVRFTLEP